MITSRVFVVLAALALAACTSSAPTAGDMQRYYEAAEQQAQRDIARLAGRRNRGEISSEEYDRRETAIKDSIPQRASKIAWARHELVQSELRGMSIPTPDAPVKIEAPGRSGGTDSFHQIPGQVNSGYQGVGSGSPAGTLQSGSPLRN